MYICCVYTLQIHASMYTRNVHRLHLQNTYAKPVCLCMTDTYVCVCIHYNYINYNNLKLFVIFSNCEHFGIKKFV